MLEQIREHSPDVIVHLGDGMEAASASRWPHEHGFTLADEFHAVNKYLLDIEKAAPNAKFVYMAGNHDDNVLALNRIDRQLRGLCDWRTSEILRERWHRWQIYPYEYSERGVYRLGQVSFYHGYESGVNSDEMQAYRLGVPYGLCVSGHTHRPRAVAQCERTKRVTAKWMPYYCNAGTLGPLKPDYVKRQDTFKWGAAVVVGSVNAKQRRSAFASNQWTAETIFKT